MRYRYRERTGGGGRRHKGPRVLIATRVHPELAEIIRDRAEDAELTVTEYIADVLAQKVEREDLLKTQTQVTPQELPLTG